MTDVKFYYGDDAPDTYETGAIYLSKNLGQLCIVDPDNSEIRYKSQFEVENTTPLPLTLEFDTDNAGIYRTTLQVPVDSKKITCKLRDNTVYYLDGTTEIDLLAGFKDPSFSWRKKWPAGTDENGETYWQVYTGTNPEVKLLGLLSRDKYQTLLESNQIFTWYQPWWDEDGNLPVNGVPVELNTNGYEVYGHSDTFDITLELADDGKSFKDRNIALIFGMNNKALSTSLDWVYNGSTDSRCLIDAEGLQWQFGSSTSGGFDDLETNPGYIAMTWDQIKDICTWGMAKYWFAIQYRAKMLVDTLSYDVRIIDFDADPLTVTGESDSSNYNSGSGYSAITWDAMGGLPETYKMGDAWPSICGSTGSSTTLSNAAGNGYAGCLIAKQLDYNQGTFCQALDQSFWSVVQCVSKVFYSIENYAKTDPVKRTGNYYFWLYSLTELGITDADRESSDTSSVAGGYRLFSAAYRETPTNLRRENTYWTRSTVKNSSDKWYAVVNNANSELEVVEQSGTAYSYAYFGFCT